MDTTTKTAKETLHWLLPTGGEQTQETGRTTGDYGTTTNTVSCCHHITHKQEEAGDDNKRTAFWDCPLSGE